MTYTKPMPTPMNIPRLLVATAGGATRPAATHEPDRASPAALERRDRHRGEDDEGRAPAVRVGEGGRRPQERLLGARGSWTSGPREHQVGDVVVGAGRREEPSHGERQPPSGNIIPR